jgi:uncharacterized GH25 family protein
MTKLTLGLVVLHAWTAAASAHDSWVQTNTPVVLVGDAVHIDLMLGNHGNEHRDFKLAGKVDLEHATLQVLGGDGAAHDIKADLTDTGYAPGEGFWTGRYKPQKPGLYMVAHTYDHVVSYAPMRSIKSAKTFFIAGASLDKLPSNGADYAQELGHALELVPQTHPVTPMGPGTPIKVKLLYHGAPLAQARVSFIPRGRQLAQDFDERYERMTDEQGLADFAPTEGDYYLIVAHHEDLTAAGEGHTGTKYSAALVIQVPAACPCCGD